MTFSPRTIALAVTFMALLGTAHAHNSWLLPSSTVFSKADTVTVDAAVSTDLFVANFNALRLDGLQITAPDGSLQKPTSEAALKTRNVFDVSVTQPGTYRIALINNGAFASWKDKATGQPKRARGTPDTIDKAIPADAQDVILTQAVGRIETFVTMGKPSALKPTGHGLELIPVGSPTDLVKGEKTTFGLNLDGKPARDLEVTVTAGGTQYRDQLAELKLKTDDKGQFSVTWPTAGMYWLDASTKDNKTSMPKATERRLSYAATLEVMP